jgi:hypothetical protein
LSVEENCHVRYRCLSGRRYFVFTR